MSNTEKTHEDYNFEHKANIVEDGVVVVFHYKLTTDEGTEIDESFGNTPVFYLHGYGNGIVEGLEKAMKGRKTGEKFSVVVSPEEGYGMPTDHEAIQVDRSEFPPDLPLEVDMMIPAELEDGNHIIFYIEEIDGDSVYLTPDHPLAGVELHFEIEIVALRQATAEELEHSHPHGIYGDESHDHHDHGCGHNCGCDHG